MQLLFSNCKAQSVPPSALLSRYMPPFWILWWQREKILISSHLKRFMNSAYEKPRPLCLFLTVMFCCVPHYREGSSGWGCRLWHQKTLGDMSVDKLLNLTEPQHVFLRDVTFWRSKDIRYIPSKQVSYLQRIEA